MAKERWEGIVSRNSKDYYAWLEYIEDEKLVWKYSDPKKITSLYKKAINSIPSEYTLHLFAEWERFESLYGSTENVVELIRKV